MIDNILDIIFVEDNPADLELTLEILKENNLANRVKVLKDGEEAVNYIFQQGESGSCGICEHPSLIILDLNLPKIDGLEILRRIRANERTKSVPVVVLTSSSLDHDKIESYHLGVNSYIEKPMKFDKFAKAVRLYHQMEGWDPDTGWPTFAKLAELGIEGAAKPSVLCTSPVLCGSASITAPAGLIRANCTSTHGVLALTGPAPPRRFRGGTGSCAACQLLLFTLLALRSMWKRFRPGAKLGCGNAVTPPLPTIPPYN